MTSRIDIEDMTDAQDEAPVRVYLKPGLIRQAGGYPATLTFPDHPKAIEYVRSDHVRPSQAGDEMVAGLVEAADRLAAEPALRGDLMHFTQFWGLDAYTPPSHVVATVRNVVHGLLALAAMDTPKGGGDE